MQNVLKKSEKIDEDFTVTLLHFAVRNGTIEILDFLIDKCGLNPMLRWRCNGFLPGHQASSLGKLETLQWLLKATKTNLNDRDNYGHTFLHIAAR